MKIHGTKIIALILGLLVSDCIFVSCHKNTASWDTQILAPVVNANMSISDLLTSNYIKNNPDNTVSLVYTDSLYNFNIDTLLEIPDTVLRYDTALPAFAPTFTVIPGGIVFPGAPTTTTYPIGSVQLTEGILHSGSLIIKIKNPLSQPVDYYYKVLNAINSSGDTLGISNLEIPAKDSVTVIKPLSGYVVDFTGPHHNGYNDITAEIKINLDRSASPLILTPGTTLMSTEVSFSNIIPYYAKGYFGTTVKKFGPQSVKFPVFNKITAGSLNIQNVSVNLTLKNGFGVDASLVLSQLYSYNSNSKDTIKLIDKDIIGTTLHVNRATPTNNAASPVDPSVLNFSINPTTSPNILQWLDNMPTSIGYALQVTTDPLGNVSGSNDFAYYGYGINANINVNIPLSLIASNLTLADTIAVNFGGSGSGNVNKHVKSGSLTIYATNGFPFSAGLQLYLLNVNNVIYDSLFIPAQTIAAGQLNPITEIVTSSRSSILTISLDAAHTQELFNTKNIVLHARFNMGSLPNTYIKIYDYYQLGLKLVGNFDYEIN